MSEDTSDSRPPQHASATDGLADPPEREPNLHQDTPVEVEPEPGPGSVKDGHVSYLNP
ncbi:hypothetical protein [Cellulomonas marina]|uniref:Uncharacterized protein n=1 Tax=Cellulomonas marina TaxID=988821 RepID=A0A1I0W548_9CELL|nr:hypothetical protein [Cellulomonas marina]GIG29977.1 hypothetical protein Cma02nite_25770 [Cellulomonas marina]SFA83360.1 hypothetical protein SAMN05421867_102160 [Cellulomonas marina]